MPEFKERPKMDKPKAKHPSTIHSKQAARLMKEKYTKELDQRWEGTESETTCAVDQVEGAGRWATDEAISHISRPRQQRKNPLKERPGTGDKSDPSERGRGKDTPQRPRQRKTTQEAHSPKPEQKARQKAANAPRERTAPAIKERRPDTQAQGEVGSTPKQRRDYSPARRAAIKDAVAKADPQRPQLPPNTQRAAEGHIQADTSMVGDIPAIEVRPKSRPPLPRGGSASTGSSAPKSKPPNAGALKKRTRIVFKTRSDLSLHKTAAQSVKGRPPAARAAKKAARQTAQRQMTQRMMAQAQRATKATMTATKKVAEAAVRAVVALVSGLAGLLGGGVLVAILLLVAIVAAIASSPFGLFFAGGDSGGSAPGTVSVAEAVAQVNMAYNSTLEGLQARTYDSIDVTGSAPEWPDVLAVFAARYAGDENGVDVATLDADRVSKLTATFWDMTTVAHTVETIDHPDSDPDDGTDDSWTEYILHITITAKTTGDMETAYGFTNYQKDAMAELLADRAALSSLAGSLDISNVDALAVLNALPIDLSPERREVVRTAMALCGKVNYFWGGKSRVIGWDSRWGQLKKVTAEGSTTTGSFRPYGLDCSGFADWVFYNASGGAYLLGHGGGAYSQHGYCTAITWDEAMPGDLVFYPEDEHVGIVCGRDESGSLLVIHCASSYNNVVITGVSGFTSIGRPLYYGE